MATENELMLRKGLQEAKSKIEEYEQFVMQLRAHGPCEVGLIVGHRKASHGVDLVLVATSGSLRELPSVVPTKLGTPVRVSENGIVVEAFDKKYAPCVGQIGNVRGVSDGGRVVEIEHDGDLKVVANFDGVVKIGDRVVLHGDFPAIMSNLGKKEDRFQNVEPEKVEWSQIGGLEDVKRDLMEAIVSPRSNAAAHRKFGVKTPKGILLYGPPGCGKTMLGKAAATALGKVNGNGAGFFYVKGPELLTKWVGESESMIRQLFARAREHQQSGKASIIFFDEADAVFGTRGSGISSDVEKTIVPQFLSEMDGFEESAGMVMLATNRQDQLDPAIVRDGRVDRRIRVARPNVEMSSDIFHGYLRNLPTETSAKDLAAASAKELFSPKRLICKVRTNKAEREFTLGHLASGAMIAGIANSAATLAMRREISTKKNTLVRFGDVATSVDRSLDESRDLNHSAAIKDFVELIGETLVGVEKVR